MSKRGLVQLKNLFYLERGVCYFEREAKLNFKLEWSFFIPFVCRLSWFIPTAACSRSSPDGLSTMSLCLLLKSSWDRYFEPCYSRYVNATSALPMSDWLNNRRSWRSFRKWRLEWHISILHIWVSLRWKYYTPPPPSPSPFHPLHPGKMLLSRTSPDVIP